MAFKSFAQYQEDKNGDFFVLPNDGDNADVVFLYRSPAEVMVGDVHYISSPSYKGYAHCCGAGCPACNYVTARGNRGIRLDHKIFIPLYNLTVGKVQFWDRSILFESVLQQSVFKGFPNPSEAVFRITRRGEARSRDTRYDIEPIAKNTFMSYDEILANSDLKLPDGSPLRFPEGYSLICKEMSISEMSSALNSTSSVSDLGDYGYIPIPRGQASAPDMTPSPAVEVPLPQYSAPPTVAPPVAGNSLPFPDAGNISIDPNVSVDVASDVPTVESNPVPEVASAASQNTSIPDIPAPDAAVPSESTDDTDDLLDNVSF